MLEKTDFTFQPKAYSEVSAGLITVQSNLAETSKITASEALEKKGGMDIYRFCNVFEDDKEEYFNDLAQIFR